MMPQMVKIFDWDKAARLICENIPQEPVKMGMLSLWHITNCTIWDQRPLRPKINADKQLWSSWNTPCIYLNGQYIECWYWGVAGQFHPPCWLEWPVSAINLFKETGLVPLTLTDRLFKFVLGSF